MSAVLRPAVEADIPFITSTWLRSFRRSKPMRNVPGPDYYARQVPLVEGLIGSATVIVATEPTTGEILGYLVAELHPTCSVAHWVHVKNTFRNLGIGGRLVGLLSGRKLPLFYTHKQSSVHGLKLAKKSGAIYAPQMLRK